MTDLNALAERLEALAAEEGGQCPNCYECLCDYPKRRDEALRQAAQALRGMGEALKPFASKELFALCERKSIRDGSTFGDASCVLYPTTLGALRDARSALKGGGSDE